VTAGRECDLRTVQGTWGKTKQNETNHDKPNQTKANQDKANQDKANQDKANEAQRADSQPAFEHVFNITKRSKGRRHSNVIPRAADVKNVFLQFTAGV
jgi:hypothetical protein